MNKPNDIEAAIEWFKHSRGEFCSDELPKSVEQDILSALEAQRDGRWLPIPISYFLIRALFLLYDTEGEEK